VSEEAPEEVSEQPSGLLPFLHEALCPKCASTGIRVVYHHTIVVSLDSGGQAPCVSWLHAGVLAPDVGQHLCLRCARCGYGWPSRTADAPFMDGLEEDEPE
jgi:hypothetical protein